MSTNVTQAPPSNTINVRMGSFQGFAKQVSSLLESNKGMSGNLNKAFTALLGPGTFVGIMGNFLALAIGFSFLNNANKSNVKAIGKISQYYKDSETWGAFDDFFSNIIKGSFKRFIQEPFNNSAETAGNMIAYPIPHKLLEDPSRKFMDDLRSEFLEHKITKIDDNFDQFKNIIKVLTVSPEYQEFVDQLQQNNAQSLLSGYQQLSGHNNQSSASI